MEGSRPSRQYIDNSDTDYNESSTYYWERSGYAPHYVRNSESFAHYMWGPGSSTYSSPYLGNDNYPYHRDISISPPRQMENSNSHDRGGSRSTYHLEEREPPSANLEGNNSPAPYIKGVESASYYSEGNVLPPQYLKKKKGHSKGTEPPQNYTKSSESLVTPTIQYLGKGKSDEPKDYHRQQSANMHNAQNHIHSVKSKTPWRGGPSAKSVGQKSLGNFFGKPQQSIKDFDRMSDAQVHAAPMSVMAQNKVRKVMRKGMPYIEAKRRILKRYFLNETRRLKNQFKKHGTWA